jgi:hypothetical protein
MPGRNDHHCRLNPASIPLHASFSFNAYPILGLTARDPQLIVLGRRYHQRPKPLPRDNGIVIADEPASWVKSKSLGEDVGDLVDLFFCLAVRSDILSLRCCCFCGGGLEMGILNGDMGELTAGIDESTYEHCFLSSTAWPRDLNTLLYSIYM